jgi:lipopolysaccharide/colanic/teichoic acid biosynthesis glycosyltransferase
MKSYFIKRPFDFLLAVAGLLLSSPLWLIVAVAIYIEDKGPVFFLQERCGTNGKSVKLIKFRSMVNVPDEDNEVMDIPGDPRVTRTGKLLRAIALDELPSLINILIGDMSFVGPRVIAFVMNGQDIKTVPGYRQRIASRPGLTGLAQLYATKYMTLEEKFKYDATYIDQMSFWLDLKLILLSFWVTFRGRWESTDKKL